MIPRLLAQQELGQTGKGRHGGGGGGGGCNRNNHKNPFYSYLLPTNVAFNVSTAALASYNAASVAANDSIVEAENPVLQQQQPIPTMNNSNSNSNSNQIQIRKFSPCGNYLLGFTDIQHSVRIYKFLGMPLISKRENPGSANGVNGKLKTKVHPVLAPIDTSSSSTIVYSDEVIPPTPTLEDPPSSLPTVAPSSSANNQPFTYVPPPPPLNAFNSSLPDNFQSSSESSSSPLNFHQVFSPLHITTLTAGPELLSSDLILFTSCKNYMILASAVASSSNIHNFNTPEEESGGGLSSSNIYSRTRQSPFAINQFDTDTPSTSYDDISLHLVHISSGKRVDRYTIFREQVHLAGGTNHGGINIFKEVLGITCLREGCILLLHIKTSIPSDSFSNCAPPSSSSSMLIPYLKIGWNSCLMDDQLFFDTYAGVYNVENVLSSESEDESMEEASFSGFVNASTLDPQASSRRPSTFASLNSSMPSNQICGLRQKLLSFLFRRAKASANPVAAMTHFHLSFSHFSELILWRMQFLSQQQILIKMGSEQSLIGGPSSRTMNGESPVPTFFCIYDIEISEVVAFCDSGSAEMLELIEKSPCFRGTAFPNEPNFFVASPANSKYALDVLQRNMYSITKAKNGGFAQSVRKAVSSLPLNPQGYSESPFFDLDLFSYDDKIINALDRARICGDYDVKFFCRRTGRLKFKLNPNSTPYPNPSHSSNSSTIKRSALYIFHPFEPFIISVQHCQGVTGPTLNFFYH